MFLSVILMSYNPASYTGSDLWDPSGLLNWGPDNFDRLLMGSTQGPYGYPRFLPFGAYKSPPTWVDVDGTKLGLISSISTIGPNASKLFNCVPRPVSMFTSGA